MKIKRLKIGKSLYNLSSVCMSLKHLSTQSMPGKSEWSEGSLTRFKPARIAVELLPLTFGFYVGRFQSKRREFAAGKS